MALRFEFRVFGDELTAERQVLQARAEFVREEGPRTDSYFVVPGRIEASLKLRGGKLDLKLLRRREDGLELWEPAAEAGFPVAPATLRAELLEPAGVLIDLPDVPVGRDLLLTLARAVHDVRIVEVGKRRRRYRVGGVAAELTRLTADGRAFASIAVEEEDRARAMGAIEALELADRQNTSYQRLLVERICQEARSGGEA